jgi:dihydroxycyclohexadiene carboxylate dehydrogenase
MTAGGKPRFGDKVVLVTGAAQGIGRATALKMAGEGARVVLADRSPEVGSVQAEIEAGGGRALTVLADLETSAGAKELVDRALDAFGRIDVSVHNVGGTIWLKPFWEYTDDEIQREISRSLWPTLWCSRAVVPVMLKQGSGNIVNVGSTATRGIYRVPYSAAKGGVHAMTTCMALELAEHGIRVNCVSPGGVESGGRKVPRNPQPLSEAEQGWRAEVTAQTLASTPLARYGSPDELAAAICFVASDEASYVTGQVWFVGGGGIG